MLTSIISYSKLGSIYSLSIRRLNLPAESFFVEVCSITPNDFTLIHAINVNYNRVI